METTVVIFRLDQMEKDSERNRAEVKEALIKVADDALVYRTEIKAALASLIAAVTKTNGRVTDLEALKFQMRGALWSLGLMLTGIGAVVGWLVVLRSGR